MNTLKLLLSGILFIFCNSYLYSVDYYWIGGNGNWSNISNWATTSGGVITHPVVPSANDNVIFDANSFTAPGQVVTINADNIFCLNIDWSAATNNPTFRGTKGQIINVFGSMTLIPNMTLDFKGDFLFRTNLPDMDIITADHPLGESVYFDGSGGWILGNSLSVDSLVLLRNGNVNTNDQLVEALYMEVEVSNDGSFSFGNSTITINGTPFFKDGNTFEFRPSIWIHPTGNFTINPGTSTIDMTSNRAVLTVDYSDLDFHNVIFSSTIGRTSLNLLGGDDIRFNSITCNTNHGFENDFTTQVLSLSPGKVYDFLAPHTYTMEQLIANGTCVAPIILKSDFGGNFATFSTTAAIAVDFVSLNNIHTAGTGSFTADNAIDLGNNDGWIINARPVADLFWVGGQGNWEDPMNWSFTSGGPGGACVPSSTDNVIFDVNSFNAPGQIVMANAENIYCRDMIWMGATGRPVFRSTDDKFIHINGSLTFMENMNMDFRGQFLFEGKNAGQTITMANHWISSLVEFNANGGEWILQDSFRVNLSIFLQTGTLRTNDQYVESWNFESSLMGVRGLFLGASTWALHVNANLIPSWSLNSENLTFDAGTSTIYFKQVTGRVTNFGNTPLQYHKVIFDNDYSYISRTGNSVMPVEFDTVEYRQGGFLYNDVKINTLRLSPGFTYRWTNRITVEIDSLIGSGNCDGLITLAAGGPGEPARMNLNKDHPNLEFLAIENIQSIGPGTPTASQSLDLGNNDGWIIMGGGSRTLFWVGGTGDWEDRAHWSLSSGGPGGECIPGPNDDVIFDANSFNGPNQSVTGALLDVYYCRNMTWENIPAGTLIRIDQLRCYGNLDLDQGLNCQIGVIYFHGRNDHTILTEGVLINQMRFESPGFHSLLDPLNCYSLIFSECDFTTADFDIEANQINIVSYANLAKLQLGNSHITVTGIKSGNSYPFRVVHGAGNVEIDPGTSLIEFTSAITGLSTLGDLQYHNILFSNTDGQSCLDNADNSNATSTFFNSVQFNNDGLITGVHEFDTLIFAPGKSYELEHSLTQTINEHFQIIGNNCTPIQLSSTQRGIASTIQMANGTVNGDFIQMQDQIAQGGATFFAGVHSTDINNSNTGWIFDTRVTFTDVGFLGEDAVICNGMPVTISAFSFSPGEQYLWSDGSTGPEVTVANETTLWARVTFANSCEILDTIRVIAGENFEANLGADTILCNGNELNLNVASVAAGLEVTWQDGSMDPSFLVNQAGEYSVSLKLQGCEERDTIQVAYIAAPNLELGADLSLCDGESFTLDVNTAGNNTYLWNDGSTNPQFQVSQAGQYKVSITNESCTVEDSIQFIFNPIPQFSLGADTSFCDGNSLLLNLAGQGDFYLWQDGSTADNFTIDQAGIYWLDIAKDGCSFRDSIQVAIRTLPIVDIGNDATLCESESLTLTAQQAGPATYFWQDGSTQSDFIATQSGQYKVIVTSNNCSVADSLNLTFNPLPQFSLGADTSFCDGNMLAPSFPGIGDTYQWQDGSAVDNFTINQAGLYWLEVALNGCNFRDSIQVAIRALPIVDIGNDATLCENESLTLTAQQAGPATYLWQDGSTQSDLIATQSGQYKVIVTSNNCSVADSLNLIFNPLPQFSLGADTSFCEGNILALSFPGIGDNYLWQDGSTNDDFTISQAGIYWLDAVKDGCSFRDSIQVDIRALPIIDLGSDATLCENESLTLSAQQPGQATYLWQDGSNLPDLTATQSGQYKVLVSSDNCSSSDSLNITFNPLPQFNLGADTSFCDGNMLTLSFPGIGDSYQWQDGSRNDNFTISQAGIYWLDVTKDGCNSRDSIQINIKALPNFSIGNDVLACEGEEVTLEAIGNADSYLWNNTQNGNTFRVSNNQQVVAVGNLNGCEDSRTVNITFNPVPMVELGPDQTSCEDSVVTLNVSSPGASFSWQDGSIGEIYQATRTGQYQVTASLANCSSQDSVNIVFNPSPVVDLGQDLTACEGETLNLVASISNADEFMWNTSSIDNSIQVSNSGNYWVEARLGNCFAADSVNVNFQAPGNIDLGGDTVLCQGTPLVLSSAVSGTYLWQDGSTGSTYTVDSSGTFSVIVDDGICVSMDSINVSFVTCGDAQIFVPNVFSPNGDGVNDGFKPIVHPDYQIISYQLRIFDRWGGFVFESRDPDATWAGRTRNELVASGVYIYFLDITYRDQVGEHSEIISGDVMLIR